ncbi:MAG: hypothetical protein K2O91_17400 [Lachnospiraceae bacterium]|nr:hypothetical protein [Lachnospiraceae bacterium]
MSVTMNTLQALDQYMTTYGSSDSSNFNRKYNKRSSRFAMHDSSELQNLYSTIQWKNRFAPLYLTDPTPRSIAYAIHLKESANSLKQTIGLLSNDDDLFSMKSAYSDNESLASVEYEPDDADGEVPTDFTLEVENFASPQVNTSKYLKANQPVSLEPGSYSFDILTNKLHYELQFNVHEGDTNNDLQKKLSRLINNSDIGVSARVVESRGLTALEVTSDAYGLPVQGERHFTITDENTTYHSGIVDYLGLNKTIKEATNAIYSIDGNEESSYSNTFSVHGAYHVTLHPENSTAGTTMSDQITARAAAITSANNTAAKNGSAKIGLYPDAESLSNNIETFVEGYNRFMNGVINDETEESLTKLLSKDLHKFLDLHSYNLEKYGISVNADATLDYQKSDEITDAAAIKGFGSQILRKLNAISLDPMEYIDRRICAYPNPNASYPNPYMTSIYTGMLYNNYM